MVGNFKHGLDHMYNPDCMDIPNFWIFCLIVGDNIASEVLLHD